MASDQTFVSNDGILGRMGLRVVEGDSGRREFRTIFGDQQFLVPPEHVRDNGDGTYDIPCWVRGEWEVPA